MYFVKISQKQQASNNLAENPLNAKENKRELFRSFA